MYLLRQCFLTFLLFFAYLCVRGVAFHAYNLTICKDNANLLTKQRKFNETHIFLHFLRNKVLTRQFFSPLLALFIHKQFSSQSALLYI